MEPRPLSLLDYREYPVLYVDRPLIHKYGGHDDQLSRTVEALDRFRIRALEKILASGVLGPEDRRAASEMLEHKVRIYAQGAMKRGRHEEAEELRSRLGDFRFPPFVKGG